MDDLEGVVDNATGQQLLSVVPAVHHQGADEALCDWTGSLSELLCLVAACGVWQVDGVGCDHDVVQQRHVLHFDALVAPLGEQLNGVAFH